MPTYLRIPFVQLQLDIKNPRLEEKESQLEAIFGMLEQQQKKLVNLAADIVEGGLNPSIRLIVSPGEEANQYIVRDGNRRVSALNLLSNPEWSRRALGGQHYPAFKRLAREFEKSPIEMVDCVVLDTEEELERWLTSIHLGENGGAGLVPWKSQEKERFKARSGKRSASSQILEIAKKSSLLDLHAKSALGSVAITTLERILRNPRAAALLGVKVAKNELYTEYPESQVLPALMYIVTQLALKKVTVRDLYSANQIEDWVRNLPSRLSPDPAQRLAHKRLLSPKSVANITPPPKPTPSSPRKPLKSTHNRKSLIPWNCKLYIEPRRINKIYFELRKLEVADTENAVAVLFRSFLEMTVDHYLANEGQDYVEAKGLTVMGSEGKNGPTLNNRLDSCVKSLESESAMPRKLLNPVKGFMKSQEKVLYCTRRFNDYVHDPNIHPVPVDLLRAWDNLQPFFEHIWRDRS